MDMDNSVVIAGVCGERVGGGAREYKGDKR